MVLKKSIVSLFFCFGFFTTHAQTFLINDFDNYHHTSDLQSYWSSFGDGAQAGPPVLLERFGVNDSNAAFFTLTWETGAFASAVYGNFNKNGFTLPAPLRDMSNYSEISFFALLSNHPNITQNTLFETDTVAKIGFTGGNSQHTVWESTIGSSLNASNRYSKYTFSLSKSTMIKASGNDSFENTLSNVRNIRLTFNNFSAKEREFIFFDDIVTIPESSSVAFLFGLGGLGIILYHRSLKGSFRCLSSNRDRH